MPFIQFLENLIDIRPELQSKLKSLINRRNFGKNEYLLQAGECCSHLHFVEKGALRGYYFLEEKEVSYWFSFENHLATSFYSFISRERSYEFIQALEDTSVSSISHKDLMDLYAEFPETEKIGRLILEKYYIRLEERLTNIQFKSAKERYAQLLEQYPFITQRASLGQIASYLGITQETLSRIRAAN
ncbi:MAG: Crp/Fnr family transcriptional regulator [Bacteroidia bacterium]